METEPIIIKGDLKVLTGLRIGAGKDTSKIGGIDLSVVKDKEGFPYIPGSSIKGKLRSLLEQKYGITHVAKWSSSDENEKKIAFVFGSEGKDRETPIVAIFRDVKLKNKGDYLVDGEIDYDSLYEVKKETAIDRITGTAKKGSLRTLERVRPGAIFEVEIVVKDIKYDKGFSKDTALELLKEGFELLANDYLGGSGTRGYGKVDVADIIKSIPEEKDETDKNNS